MSTNASQVSLRALPSCAGASLFSDSPLTSAFGSVEIVAMSPDQGVTVAAWTVEGSETWTPSCISRGTPEHLQGKGDQTVSHVPMECSRRK